MFFRDRNGYNRCVVVLFRIHYLDHTSFADILSRTGKGVYFCSLFRKRIIFKREADCGFCLGIALIYKENRKSRTGCNAHAASDTFFSVYLRRIGNRFPDMNCMKRACGFARITRNLLYTLNHCHRAFREAFFVRPSICLFDFVHRRVSIINDSCCHLY